MTACLSEMEPMDPVFAARCAEILRRKHPDLYAMLSASVKRGRTRHGIMGWVLCARPSPDFAAEIEGTLVYLIARREMAP